MRDAPPQRPPPLAGRVSARIFVGPLSPLRGESEPTKIRRRTRNLRTQTREGRARNWVGFGLPRPWRDGGLPHGSAGVPHGLAPLTGPITTHMPPSRVRLYERTYPPEGGELLARLVRSYEKRGVAREGICEFPSRVPSGQDPVRGAPSLLAITSLSNKFNPKFIR